MTEFLLVRTCIACPEQYDVVHDGAVVGYLRLRHGHFRAHAGDGPYGPEVYTADPEGDGIFEDAERPVHLQAALTALAAHMGLAAPVDYTVSGLQDC